jgi:hypothetical protein
VEKNLLNKIVLGWCVSKFCKQNKCACLFIFENYLHILLCIMDIYLPFFLGGGGLNISKKLISCSLSQNRYIPASVYEVTIKHTRKIYNS